MSAKKADILIYKYIIGTLSSDENKHLQNWLEESPTNRAFFEKIYNSDKISSQYDLYQSIDEKKAYERFLMLTNQKGRRFTIQPLLKYAAIFVVALSITLTFFIKNNGRQYDTPTITPGSYQAVLVTNSGAKINLNSDTINKLQINKDTWVDNHNGNLSYSENSISSNDTEYNTVIIPRGGEYKITLADDTKVHLNSQSELRYPTTFNGNSRNVYLKGEGYFDIAPDAQRPFFVHANGLKIKQYGTGFNVYSRDINTIDVVLVHGSVSVITPDNKHAYKMEPSQLAHYNSKNNKVDIQTVDINTYIGWTKGRFVFENKSLSNIMEALSLWYNFDYEFDKAVLEEIKFTGNVSKEAHIESIFHSIEFTTNVHIVIEDGKVIINS